MLELLIDRIEDISRVARFQCSQVLNRSGSTQFDIAIKKILARGRALVSTRPYALSVDVPLGPLVYTDTYMKHHNPGRL